MPYILERYGDKAIVVKAKSGRHHSLKPIPLQDAKAQMRVLEGVASKEDPPMKNPCWKGYEMIGTKVKDGRTVPNCVPEKTKPLLK